MKWQVESRSTLLLNRLHHSSVPKTVESRLPLRVLGLDISTSLHQVQKKNSRWLVLYWLRSLWCDLIERKCLTWGYLSTELLKSAQCLWRICKICPPPQGKKKAKTKTKTKYKINKQKIENRIVGIYCHRLIISIIINNWLILVLRLSTIRYLHFKSHTGYQINYRPNAFWGSPE